MADRSHCTNLGQKNKMRYSPDHPHRVIPASDLEGFAEQSTAERAKRVQQIIDHLAPDDSQIPSVLLSGLARLFEALIFCALAVVVFVVYVQNYEIDLLLAYPPLVIVSVLVFSVSLKAFGVYRIEELLQPVKAIPKLALATVCVAGTIFALLFFSKIGEVYSRVWLDELDGDKSGRI